MNLPNKLTILRIILVPFCMFFIAFTGMNDTAARLIALVLFSVTSLTDMLDGKIARKYNLITDFGKFLDPVADKLLIIGSYLAILVRYRADTVFTQVMFWCLFIIFFRELAVTSLRMIVANKVVIAADKFGKIKTVSQMVCVIVVLVEPVLFGTLFPLDTHLILSYVTVVFSALMTLFSGLNYFKSLALHQSVQ
ncbi:MAG: CDP-diacylglycerol--glycerol-3-phosphate 3-phosphatidyltransferase, partial [Ruminococcaceae bacterium]|nr:CDP-diacylglycerol--glycerol-3-phosphate 3-phosphatidyltransferase [Oscillospiraceae bacterium]